MTKNKFIDKELLLSLKSDIKRYNLNKSALFN